MITISKQGNTLFFNSSIHGLALGYLVVQFRKRNNCTKLSVLRNCFKRARKLESNLPLIGLYAKTCFQAKKQVYSIRYDLTRDLDTVIHPIIEENQQVSIGEAWDLVMNSKGYSVFTGKPIKPITCKEKRVKVLKQFINLLSENA